MKTINFLIITVATLFVFGTLGCQTQTESKSAAVNQPANKTTINTGQPEAKPAVNNNKPETIESGKESAAGSLESPTAAYKTAYAARKIKDVKELKRVLSNDMLQFFALLGEDEKMSVDDALKQLAERPQAATNETRNEKISGDRATLEYPDEQGKWKTMDFVKEGGEWKLTMPDKNSPDRKGE